MDFQQARDILLDNIKNNKRHADYKRVTELADKYHKLITGENIESLLRRFNPREDEVLFEQRKALTIAITPAIVGSIMKPFYKVPRTAPLTAKVEPIEGVPDTTSAEMIKTMEDRMAGFYGVDAGQNGLDFFLQNRFVELSFSDPNAWIVVEFDAFNPVKEKAKPRPYEVSSLEAINFSMKNNSPEWLHVKVQIDMKPKDPNGKVEKGDKHTLYGDDVAVVYEQTLLKQNEVPDGSKWLEIEGKYFLVSEYPIAVGKVPAFRVGYLRDMATNGRTFLSPFHPAMPYLDKSIKQVSEYDLSHCLHVFPQKIIRLTKTCPGVPGDPNGRCIGGRLRDGHVCPTCNGTGKAVHGSGMDVIEVELPEVVKDEGFVPLSEMVHYVDLPVELLKFQQECVDKFTPQCHQAVFNSTVLVQKDGSPASSVKTAFEVDNDMDSVYDTLSPFADKYSCAWTNFVELIAILTDYRDKLNIIHRFPSKFQLKTRERLYAEYKNATDSNMPSFVIETLSDELAETIYMDQANELLRYRVKKMHFPFNGKTKEEIMMLLTSADVLKETKVLYAYFDQIINELEMEYRAKASDFFALPYEEQKELISGKVDELAAGIEEQTIKAQQLLMDPNDKADPKEEEK